MNSADAGDTLAAMWHGARAAADGEEALCELFRLHGRALYLYAFAVTRSAEDAEDAVQDVFARIAQKKARLDNVGSPKSYLFRSVRNAAYSHLRRKRVQERSVIAIGSGLEADQPVSVAEAGPSAVSLRQAFGILPVEQREVLALKVFSEMTFRDIAETLGISINTAAGRYRYAIDKLRRALEDDSNG